MRMMMAVIQEMAAFLLVFCASSWRELLQSHKHKCPGGGLKKVNAHEYSLFCGRHKCQIHNQGIFVDS
jgi:hypothetical protein